MPQQLTLEERKARNKKIGIAVVVIAFVILAIVLIIMLTKKSKEIIADSVVETASTITSQSDSQSSTQNNATPSGTTDSGAIVDTTPIIQLPVDTVQTSGQIVSTPAPSTPVIDCTVSPYDISCIRGWWSGANCTTDPSLLTTKITSWNAMSATDVQNDINSIATSTDELLVNQCYGIPGLQAKTNVLVPGQSLAVGQSLWSPNRVYELRMQSDGNLVVYQYVVNADGTVSTTANSVKWAMDRIPLPRAAGSILTMRPDGNLVMTSPSGAIMFQTFTDGYPNSFLQLRDNGSFFIMDQTSTPLWASSTVVPYSNKIISEWWRKAGCTTDIMTQPTGAAAGSTDYTNKSWYAAREAWNVQKDMRLWAAKDTTAHNLGCYGVDPAPQ
jgi:hypothetical protein